MDGTIHPNGRKFHTPYSANPNRKKAKKLKARVDDYNRMITQPKFNTSGFHKPGSNNK